MKHFKFRKAGLSSMAAEQGSVGGLTVSTATPPTSLLDIHPISASTSMTWHTTYQIGPGWEAGELEKFQKH